MRATDQADKLSSGEGEGGRDKDAAETTEAVGKGTGLIPQVGSNVVVVAAAGGTAAEDENKGDDHEDDNGTELEHRSPELLLGVAKGAKDVDDDDGAQEDGDPDGCGDKMLDHQTRYVCLFGLFTHQH